MVVTAVRTDRTILNPAVVVDTPALLVDEAILHQNIAEMAAAAKSFGVALRPHIKTHKSPKIARLQIAAGAVGIMCAKLGEAEVFAAAGIDDIAVGYQLLGEPKIARLLTVMEQAQITVAVDAMDAALPLSRAMARQDRTLPVYLEIDTGHHRAGVPVGKPAVELALRIARLPGLRLAGIMTHEGHASAESPEMIRGTAIAAGEAMVETAEMIRTAGVELETVSVGSTPCATYTPSVPGITEMRPGTYVFRDTMGFRYGIFGPDRCAVRYLATVASRPAPDRAVLDAGAKTLAADLSLGHPGHGYIVGHPNARIARLNEEHGVVILPEGEPGFALGERVEIIPNHVCTSVNLHDRMLVVRDGEIVDEWPVAARGRVQ
jgi:D-serine deaminase-like pyridoxal phosphate-dependent protein